MILLSNSIHYLYLTKSITKMKYFFLIGLIYAGSLSCSKKQDIEKEVFEISQNKDQITLNDSQIKNAGIQIGTIQKQYISSKIILNGNTKVPPNATAYVSAHNEGHVKYSSATIGKYVKKGEVLAVLEDPNIIQLQQEYLLAKSNLSYAEKNYIRQRELNENKSSSDKATQMAQTEFRNQQIILRGIEQKLKIMGINPTKLHTGNIQRNITVNAPISGYISVVNISIGQHITPMDKLFSIINTDQLELVLKVFEKDLKNISIGQKIHAYTNQNPNKKYLAYIYSISRNFETDKGVLVHCRFDDNTDQLINGIFMNADVEMDHFQTIAIPDDAIISWEEKQYIFEEIKPKIFKMLNVQIGKSNNGYTELLNFNSDFSKRKFVTKGAYNLLMGLKNIEE